MKTVIGLCFLGMVGMVPATFAQEEAVSKEFDAAKEEVGSEKKAEEVKEGWDNTLSLGANFSYGQSKSWVGNPDGATMQIGVLMNGAANYRKGSHRWLNEGKLVHTQTRTPTIPVFVKSADELVLKSTYYYAPKRLEWLGPFGRGTLSTPLFPGYYVGSESALVNEVSGDTTTTFALYEPLVDGVPYKLGLSSGFEPMILKEVGGVMASPVDKGNRLKLSCHLGLGAEEVLTQGGYVVKEVNDTAGEVDTDGETFSYAKTVVVVPLESYQSVGAEFELNASGALGETMTWTFNATFFQPVYTTSVTAEDVSSLLNVDTSGKVSVKLAKWASLDIVVAARKYPLILDEWQFQSGLLLTTTFNLI